TGNFRLASSQVSNPPAYIGASASSGGCGGSIMATSAILAFASLVCVAFVLIKRKKFTSFEK
ncbi:MAG: hypothetical protein WC201_02405, partial [Bacilli bacterium]